MPDPNSNAAIVAAINSLKSAIDKLATKGGATSGEWDASAIENAGQQTGAIKEQTKAMEGLSEAHRDHVKVLEREEEHLKSLKDEELTELEIKQRNIDLLEIAIEKAKLQGDNYDANAKELKKQTKALQKDTKAQDANNQARETMLEHARGFLGMARSFEDTLAGQTVGMFKAGKATEEYAEKLKKTFSGLNIAEATGQKLLQTTLFFAKQVWSEMEEGSASYNQATGMSDKYAVSIDKAAAGMREYGITATDVGQAHAALAASFPLRELGKESEQLAANFALWQKQGVSVDSAISSYKLLRFSFKETDAEAQLIQERIMQLGKDIGVGAGKMLSDFAAAAPRLAIFGDSMEKTFKKVASAAAQLGLEVGDVISLAEGFQTFEGAAQATGKLNSILGGGFIDNIELMNASFEDPAEAALMIQNAFTRAGETVESLGPAGVKAAAAAAGFSDVAKFTSFLNGTIDAKELAQDEGAEREIEMLATAKASLTLGEAMKSAQVDYFKEMTGGYLAKWAKWFRDDFSKEELAMLGNFGPVIAGIIAGVAGRALALLVGRSVALQMAATTDPQVTHTNTLLTQILGWMKIDAKKVGSASGGFFAPSKAGMGAALAGTLIGGGMMMGGDSTTSAVGAGVASGAGMGAMWGLPGAVIGAIIGGIGGYMLMPQKETTNAIENAAKDKAKKDKETVRTLKDIKAELEERNKRDIEQLVKVKLDVDDYAYRKGFRLSTQDTINNPGGA